MNVPTLPGVTAKTITTERLTTRVLFSGPEDGIPVLFIHGNFSSATWWEETMLALPSGYRAIAADQRGLGESDHAVKINAQNGMGDFVGDTIALMDTLGHSKFHLAGVSLGGVIAWWLMADAPDRLLSVTLAGPGSPYGFGGTRDAQGTPTCDDFAGSGGGLANPVLYQGLLEKDRSLDSPFTPRNALRLLVWGPPFVPEREEVFLDTMFQVEMGEQGMPGDKVDSPNWPYVAPGKWGPLNALSPKYTGNLVERILGAEPKIDVLWIYGAEDAAVSNSAASDPGTWGPSGRVPGFPGAKEYPPQPMMDQIRLTLEDYAGHGGHYEEVAVEGAGHVPFLSHPDVFNPAFHAFLKRNDP